MCASLACRLCSRFEASSRLIKPLVSRSAAASLGDPGRGSGSHAVCAPEFAACSRKQYALEGDEDAGGFPGLASVALAIDHLTLSCGRTGGWRTFLARFSSRRSPSSSGLRRACAFSASFKPDAASICFNCRFAPAPGPPFSFVPPATPALAKMAAGLTFWCELFSSASRWAFSLGRFCF